VIELIDGPEITDIVPVSEDKARNIFKQVLEGI
jgi:hypothetical protein